MAKKPASPKGKPGRPPEPLTPDQRAKVLELLRLGLSMPRIANVIGRTINAIDREAARDPDGFGKQKNAAVDDGIAKLLANIETAGNSGQWQACAWLLERRRPQEYGKRNPDALTPKEMAAAITELSNLARKYIPPELSAEYDAELKRLLDRQES